MDLKPYLVAAGIGGVLAWILLKDDDAAFFKGVLIGGGVQLGVRLLKVS